MFTTQPITFAGFTAQNAADQACLDAARAEHQECIQSYINEGDVALVLVDFEGDAMEEQLDDIKKDAAERVQAAADPGRHEGLSLSDVTFDLSEVYWWAKEDMERRIDHAREEQGAHDTTHKPH